MSEETRLTLPIAQMALENDKFRKVVWTGEKTQLVVMAIPEGEDIGAETHEGHDQLLYFVAGSGRAEIGSETYEVQEGDVSIVPSGVYHNFINTGSGMLKLYTTYCPPEHAPGTEHADKSEDV
ncbi:cupin domain-containing protein [Halorhodospira halochloris]|uniref:Mannose-6-phosphate isomerase n=1 Tax=Halorhodospira halochloris TaxID=1052 RepID=A0A0X8X9T3_HALHR|nr:cupin domain-containing protein [Halorhodospira halochloris]MBK1652825.1 cupin [Halorhodospira halochloris]MCG5531488.1 cupin domain-containing protein [Halorhodospira halochloris]MCG5549351.1 cupin domain-containing protein [Halorhodospira halochloris]BAU58070.1 mannose-6-phosphate isomerase [Halorhodospira halochloris]